MSNKQMELDYKKIAPGIFMYYNVFNDIDLFLSNLIKSFEEGTLMWHEKPHIISNSKAFIDKNIRDLKTFTIPYKFTKVLLNTHHTPKQTFNNFVGNILYNILNPIEKHYSLNNNNIKTFSHDAYYLFKYEKNNFFKSHVDDGPLFPRVISVLYYLNSDYEGGEIEFPEFNIKCKPEKNSVLVFPSNFIYHHEVHPITNGTKYSIATWLMYNDYEKVLKDVNL